jgi:hypothetical protein
MGIILHLPLAFHASSFQAEIKTTDSSEEASERHRFSSSSTPGRTAPG